MTVCVERANLSAPGVLDLFVRHVAHNSQSCPSGTDHGLDARSIEEDGVTLYAAHCDGKPAGIGALKVLGAHEGEVKSMHTEPAMRGRGVGRAVLGHILDEAERRGLSTLFLETGTSEGYSAARTLYEREGFQRCGPFAGYPDHPASAFYVRRVTD